MVAADYRRHSVETGCLHPKGYGENVESGDAIILQLQLLLLLFLALAFFSFLFFSSP